MSSQRPPGPYPAPGGVAPGAQEGGPIDIEAVIGIRSLGECSLVRAMVDLADGRADTPEGTDLAGLIGRLAG